MFLVYFLICCCQNSKVAQVKRGHHRVSFLSPPPPPSQPAVIEKTWGLKPKCCWTTSGCQISPNRLFFQSRERTSLCFRTRIWVMVLSPRRGESERGGGVVSDGSVDESLIDRDSVLDRVRLLTSGLELCRAEAGDVFFWGFKTSLLFRPSILPKVKKTPGDTWEDIFLFLDQ